MQDVTPDSSPRSERASYFKLDWMAAAPGCGATAVRSERGVQSYRFASRRRTKTMSIINAPKISRSRAARIALIPAVALGLIGGPVALAGPATAATSERGCTVDPLKPRQNNWDRGKTAVDFRIYVNCDGNKTVQIRQLRFEEDHGRHDDFLGASVFWESFGRHDNAVRIHSYDRVPNGPGSEEVYQLVSFRVRSDNGHHWSDWTRWEKSEVARIH